MEWVLTYNQSTLHLTWSLHLSLHPSHIYLPLSSACVCECLVNSVVFDSL